MGLKGGGKSPDPLCYHIPSLSRFFFFLAIEIKFKSSPNPLLLSCLPKKIPYTFPRFSHKVCTMHSWFPRKNCLTAACVGACAIKYDIFIGIPLFLPPILPPPSLSLSFPPIRFEQTNLEREHKEVSHLRISTCSLQGPLFFASHGCSQTIKPDNCHSPKYNTCPKTSVES